jgi:hypothetical protein
MTGKTFNIILYSFFALSTKYKCIFYDNKAEIIVGLNELFHLLLH